MRVAAKRPFILLTCLILLLACMCVSRTRWPGRPGRIMPSDKTVMVRGYIAVRVGQISEHATVALGKSPADLYVPGVKVWLEDATSGATTADVQTDLSGRFTLPALRNSRARVCWKAEGFRNGCSEFFAVSAKNIHLSRRYAEADRIANTTVVYGNVRLADGTLPRYLQPLAGINAFATVSLLDEKAKRIASAYVNNFGDYILPQVPSGREEITLVTQLEGGEGRLKVLKFANLAGASLHRIDLKIRNHRPRLNPLIPLDSLGARMKVASSGATVAMHAEADDPDGDVLTYKWAAAAGSGVMGGGSGSIGNWTVPASEGTYTCYLTVSDGKGGYASKEVSLRVDPKGIRFSGFVRGSDVPALAGAAIRINGSTATSGSNGFFEMHVADAKRFVLHIDKPGYAFVSKIFDGPVTGGEWIMTRATVVTIDPTRDQEVVNTRKSGDCPGPMAAQLNWKDYPRLAEPQWQDGKKNVIRSREKLDVPLTETWYRRHEQDCGPGIRVRLSANSLQDASGNAPAGPVNVELSTIDLASPWQMPGDYSVRAGGGIRVMQSWGAGTVEIRSGAVRYNLRPGATAEVTIPVDRLQLTFGSSLPSVIPLLSYNESDGLWEEEGFATLVGTNYVAKVKHFSAINTDLVKTNQSCVRVLSPTLPPTYNLELTIPGGSGAAPILINRLVDNGPTQEHVVYNLPSNVNIVLVPIRVADNTPIGTFVVNTGPAQVPTTPNLPAGPPYVACASTVELTELAVPELPVTGEFLHGLYSFEASNLFELNTSNPALAAQLDTATANYYTQIDPRGKRLTLNAFKTTNGFGGSSEVRAVFANGGDLGFGRDMHCNKQTASDGGTDIACYVSNYGSIVTPDTDDAALAAAAGAPVATVAMEYSRIESAPTSSIEFDDPERVVKFYVYNSDGSTLLRSADLDTGGVGDPRPRPIPQLCMVCHNGEYPAFVPSGTAPPFNSRADVKLKSRFLPFDLHYYVFPASPFDKTSQQDDFKKLNEDMVKNTPPDSTAIADIVTQMYVGGPNQDENFFVTGWGSAAIHQNFYRNTVARTCRTCHAAQIFPELAFDQSTQFVDRLGSVESRVCTEHVMPHAKATHDVFWKSVGPHMPAQLQVYGDTFGSSSNGWNGQKCGQFVAAGSSPSYYDTVIQPIWDGDGTGTIACTSCHVGSSPQGGLSLASGTGFSSRDNIVNVPAIQLSSMDRIEPNNTATSYLLHKLKGTHAGVGGSGQRMPRGCPTSSRPCLTATDEQKVVDWINAGAPP